MLTRRVRRARRRIAVLAIVTLFLTIAMPTSYDATKQGPEWPSLSWLWSWATPGAWASQATPATPTQHGGTAKGLSHTASAASTRAGRGAGQAPGRGIGELPAYGPHQTSTKPVTTGPAVGAGAASFNAATSRRMASASTATSDLYQNADGTFTREVSAAPVNYKAADGGWRPIDTRVSVGADSRLHVGANRVSADFAQNAGDPTLVSIGVASGQSLGYGLQGAAPVRPTTSGSTVTYPGVLPGTDLVLDSLSGGVKDSLVLHSAGTATTWLFPLSLHGLTARIAADGSVEFVDGSGTAVGRIPHGYMQDSRFNRATGGFAESSAVTYSLVTSGGRPALKMSVDASWLRDPSRVFPVKVDPSYAANSSGSTFVLSDAAGDYSGRTDLRIGTANSGTEAANSFVAFSGLGTSLAGDHITSAQLNLFDYWASSCTAQRFDVAAVTQSWTVTGSKTYPGPAYGSSIGSLTADPGAACTNTALSSTVGTLMSVPLATSTFNTWTSGGANYGLAVYGSSTGTLTYKRFDSANTSNPPLLLLTYAPNQPPQIDTLYPPTNYNAPTLTPELIALGHDPDSYPAPAAVTYDFTVYSGSGTQLTTSGFTSSNSWTVPTGILNWAQTYYWSAQAYDGLAYSTATNASYFTTTVPQPLITSGLSQNTSDHGIDPAAGNYTTAATDAQVQTVGPSLSVQRDYNSLDPRTTGAFGAGWSSLFDMKAVAVLDSSGTVTGVIITYPTGEQVEFGRNPDGTFVSPQGRYSTLTTLTTGYKLVDKSGTGYTFGQTTGVSGVYALTSIADYQGRTETFTYASSLLTTVTSAVSGRALHFTWSTPSGASNAHVATVATDPVVPGTASSALAWTYSYTGDQLTTVCPPTSSTACTGYGYTSGSHYRTTVVDAGPRDYWRLNDAAGATAATDQMLVNENTLNGTYGTTSMAGGTAGPLADGLSSATFDGSTGGITLPNGLLTATTYLSIGMWFKTTSTSTGTLFSTGHSTLGTTSPDAGAMPVLYVGSDGKLYGHFWDSTVAGISSSAAVNDGTWHQVTLTSAGNTQTLYLDGAAIGTQSGQLSNIDPVDLVGAGVYNSFGWPAAPSGATWNHFNGQIAEVSYYTRPLPASVIGQQWTAAHTQANLLNTITLPSGKTETTVSYNAADDNVSHLTDLNGGTWTRGTPTVTGSSLAYAGAVLGSAPMDYWRLGESGVSQAVNQVRGGTATYNSVTLGVQGAFGTGDNTAASFNGTSSYLQLPGNLFPSGGSSQELWFSTTSTGQILLSSQAAAIGATGTGLPVLWITSDGKLRGLSPSTAANGPFNSGLTGKCLDDASGASANGTHVQISDCTGGASQNWTMNADGTIRDYGKCLEAGAGGTANGTLIDLSDCTGAANQVWQVYSGGLRNPVSGRCLDDPSASTTNGTQLQLLDCVSGAAKQSWIQSLASSGSVADGKWHHVVLAGTGTAQSLYLDGTLAQSTTGSVTLTPGTQPYAYLGAGYTGVGASGLTASMTSYFTGSIEEAAFYRTALSSADAARHWAAYKSAFGVAPVETVQITDPGGFHTTYVMDPQNGNRELSITDGLGGKTSFGYDVLGFQYTVTDPNGAVTTTGHDVRGNMVSHTVCQNQATNTCSTEYYTYYPDDTTASPAWDPRNDMVSTERDGRSSSATDPRYVSTYAYDAAGNRTSVTTPPVAGYPNGRTSTTVFTNGTTQLAADTGYAPAGLVASTTTPGGATETVTYLKNGDPAKVSDPAGEVTTYTYDGVGRVITKTVISSSYPSGLTTSYTYDGQNRPLTVTDPPITDRVTGAVHTARTTNAYSVDGETLSTTVTDLTGGDASRTTTNTYDASNRVAGTTDPAGVTTAYTYDAYGNRTSQVEPNGVTDVYAYDANSRLITTTLKSYTGDPVNPSTAADLVLSSRAYDPVGRLASITDSMGWVTAYTYTDDGLTATIARKDPSTGATFLQQSNTYDAAGNLVSQLTNNGTTNTTYTVDAASRTTSATLDPTGVNRTTSHTFSPDDFVVSTRVSDANGVAAAADTTYDALGRKTSSTTHNDVTGHPVSWWKLSDGALSGSSANQNYAVDSSGSGNTAALSSGGVAWAAGATFNGAAAGISTTGAAVNTAGDFSVSAWVDPTALSTSAWQTFVSQQGSQQAAFDLEYDPTSGKWAFTRALTDTANASFVHAESSTAAVAGIWTHLTGTYKASTGAMTLYVNGVASGTATDTTPAASSGSVSIGHGFYNGAALSYASAQIANVQLYNRTLASADTSVLYGYGRTGAALASAAAWWKLADGATNPTSTTAVDSSGSTNNATLSGSGVSWSAGAAFNGTSGSVSPGTSVVNTASDFSVSAWVDPVALTSTGWQTFVVQQGSQQGGLYLEYDATTGKWAFTRALSDTANASFVHAESGSAAVAGAWTHLVGTYKASTGALTLYVNGVVNGTATDTTPFASGGALAIGHGFYNGAVNNYANGQVADVQIYSRTLASTDASTLYTNTRTGAALDSGLLTTRWALDQRGLPTSSTDPAGNVTNYAYDEAGHLAVTTAPTVNAEANGGAAVALHPVSTTGYNTFGEAVESQNADGNITVAAYDAAGREVSTTLPSYTPPGTTTAITPVSTKTYNNQGQVVSTTDPLNHTTAYAYDQLGDAATVTDPAGGVTHYTYDTNGDKLSTTEPTGAQVQATYDYLGREATATELVRQNSAAYTTTNTYTGTAGYLTSTTSAAGVVTSYGYNAAGQITSTTDGAGHATTARFDALGRVTATVLPDGTSGTATFDEAGRQTGSAQLDSGGATLSATSAAYDVNGHVVASTDALGHTSTFSYDATGMLTAEVQPVTSSTSITTSFGYDAAGNRTRFTDGRGNAFITTYNSLGLPESSIEPATTAYPNAADRIFTVAYDAAGQAVSQTSPGGVVVTNAYDNRGDLTSQTGTGADAATTAHTFGYDSGGRLTSGNAPSGTDTFTYDDRGLLLSTAGPSGASSFTYTSDGSLSTRADASGTSNYTYDTAGRLSTLTDAATGTTSTYGYNANNELTSTSYGSGKASRAYTYNSLHQLTSDTLVNPSGGTEASIAYGYDLNGNETSKSTTGVSGSTANTYTYDQANRLTSWNNGTTTVGYAYDASGNRTQSGTKTFAYDARNELTSDGTSTYTYTPRGTLALTVGSGTTAASTSDAFNRVITDGNQTYAYDALDRVTTTSAGNTFSYSGSGNDAASDGAYTYSRDPSGRLVGIALGGSGVLALTDQHTDLVAEFTASGTSLNGSVSYDPLGNITATSGMTGNLGYQSGWTDAGSSKVNMASRWYNPATGQFNSRDTVSNSPTPNSAGANRFAYDNDNPLIATDPSGHCGGWFDIGCNFQQAVHAVTSTPVFHAVTSFVHAAVHAVTSFAHTVAHAVSSNPVARTIVAAVTHPVQTFQSAWHAVTTYAKPYVAAIQRKVQAAKQWVGTQINNAKHAVTTWANKVNDSYQKAKQQAAVTITHWTNNAKQAIKTLKSAAVYTWQHPVAALQKAANAYVAVNQSLASAAVTFVQHHAADIVSFVASTAVFVGCEAVLGAATAGVGAVVGAVGCGALAGAVGSAITYGMTTPVSKWSLGGAGAAIGIGALTGAAGSLLGAAGGKLVATFGSKLLGPALESIAGRLGPAAIDDAAATVADDSATALSRDAASAAEPHGAGGSEPSASGDGGSSDTSACTHSFDPSTQVLMADGTTKAIKDVKTGDKVLSTDPTTGKTTAEPVQLLHDNHDTDLADVTVQAKDGTKTVLHTTWHHPFWNATTKQWTDAADLKPGTALQAWDGDQYALKVISVKTWTGLHDMRDLTVAVIHTYYLIAGVTPVLVHNCSATLGRNLRASGDSPTIANSQAHHIVPETHGLAGAARRILASHGIGIDSAENGVWLAHGSHVGTFTNAYVSDINDQILSANTVGGKAAVLDVLSSAKQILQAIDEQIGNGL
jgi:RHS repeat-associated protein